MIISLVVQRCDNSDLVVVSVSEKVPAEQPAVAEKSVAQKHKAPATSLEAGERALVTVHVYGCMCMCVYVCE